MFARIIGTIGVITLSSATLAQLLPANSQNGNAQWIAGDHHIHSRFSVGWDQTGGVASWLC